MLVGYCGVPMVVVALLLLVHPHETAEALGFEPDHPFALFFGWAYLGMALSALGALHGRGGWLTAPAVTWGVFFTGATFVHVGHEGGVGALGHGGREEDPLLDPAVGDSVFEEVVNAVGVAAAAGVVMVAAAGRHCHQSEGCGDPFPNEARYPAAYSDVIAVSGVNQNLTFADVPDDRDSSCGGISSNHSNASMDISVSAPFDALTTQADPLDRYEVVCGTSTA